MSRTLSLVCVDCNIAVWIAQESGSSQVLYSGEEKTMESLRTFLFVHKNHTLKFVDSEYLPYDCIEIDTDAITDADVAAGTVTKGAVKCSYCGGKGKTWRTSFGKPPYIGSCDYCNGTGKIEVTGERNKMAAKTSLQCTQHEYACMKRDIAMMQARYSAIARKVDSNYSFNDDFGMALEALKGCVDTWAIEEGLRLPHSDNI